MTDCDPSPEGCPACCSLDEDDNGPAFLLVLDDVGFALSLSADDGDAASAEAVGCRVPTLRLVERFCEEGGCVAGRWTPAMGEAGPAASMIAANVE